MKKFLFIPMFMSLCLLGAACMNDSPPITDEKTATVSESASQIPNSTGEIIDSTIPSQPENESVFWCSPQHNYAFDGTYIYFCDSGNDDALTRMTLSLEDKLVLDDSVCSDIFIDDTHIYYCVDLPTTTKPTLCKIAFDGTGRTELAKDTSILGLTDDKIVCMENCHFKLLDKDGTLIKIRTEDYVDYSIYEVLGERIICSNWDGYQHSLYNIALDGTDIVRLNKDYASDINIFDNTVYYVESHENIVSVDPDGSDRRVIAGGGFGCMTATPEYIYYSDFEAEPHGLYRIKHDGTDKTALFTEENVDSISIIGNCIFFTSYRKDPTLGGNIHSYYYMLSDGSNLLKMSEVLPE